MHISLSTNMYTYTSSPQFYCQLVFDTGLVPRSIPTQCYTLFFSFLLYYLLGETKRLSIILSVKTRTMLDLYVWGCINDRFFVGHLLKKTVESFPGWLAVTFVKGWLGWLCNKLILVVWPAAFCLSDVWIIDVPFYLFSVVDAHREDRWYTGSHYRHQHRPG